MDTSYWTNLNPKIEVVPTTAVKYKTYTAIAKYYLPGGTYLRPYSSRWTSAVEYVDWRVRTARNYRSAMGSWRVPYSSYGAMDATALEHFKSVLTNPAFNIKFRIEEPHVSVYGTNEQNVKDIVTLLGNYNSLRRVEVPTSEDDIELLKSGVVFRKTDTGYKYKITLRDSWGQSDQVTASIVQVLINQGNNVLISRNINNKLSATNKQRYYYYGVWFYANDLAFLTFLQLIKPNCILKVEEVVVRK